MTKQAVCPLSILPRTLLVGAPGLSWVVLLLIVAFFAPATQASSPPVIVGGQDPSPLSGHLLYMVHNEQVDRQQLVAGRYAARFQRYDDRKAWMSRHGIWLHFQLAHTGSSPDLVISMNESLYSEIELLYQTETGQLVSEQAGLALPAPVPAWHYNDIAFAVTQQPGTTRDYYLRFKADFPILMSAQAATLATYAQAQTQQTAHGHLLVGIMLGILLYLAMITLYVRRMQEVHHCLAFVATSLAVLLFGRGYIFAVLPHHPWLNLHLYGFIFTTLTITYLSFSRYHFKTRSDFPFVDRLLQGLQYASVALLAISTVIPVTWMVLCIQVLAFGVIILLCILSVYIWSNSQRRLTAYVSGTLVFLFSCILATAESNGLIDMGGLTRNGFEVALCFQATLFALALAEKINEYQREQTALAIRAAEADAESRAKSNFLAKMSHELRTPMNGLLGMLQLLDQTTLDDQQQHYTRIMKNSGRLLLGVIDDVLDYSRIVSGKLRIEESDFSLPALLDDIQTLFQESARQKQLSLTFNLANNTPVWLHADPMRLRQVLNNLVGNAIKFTSSGSVSVRVRVEQANPDQWLLQAEIEDTGCGIEAEHIADLFQDFSRTGTTTRSYGGSGLGLAICKQLVEMMGGSIQVESAPNYGSLFRFYVKVAPGQPDVPVPAPPRQGIKHDIPASVRLLIAEDNEINREVVKGLLERMGLSPLFVANGAEAVRKVCDDNQHWDLILMDIEMPILDGLAAAQAIRHWEAAQCRNAIPIVALTAHAGRGYEDIILQAGMDDHLSKPIDYTSLQVILQKWLGQRDPPKQ